MLLAKIWLRRLERHGRLALDGTSKGGIGEEIFENEKRSTTKNDVASDHKMELLDGIGDVQLKKSRKTSMKTVTKSLLFSSMVDDEIGNKLSWDQGPSSIGRRINVMMKLACTIEFVAPQDTESEEA